MWQMQGMCPFIKTYFQIYQLRTNTWAFCSADLLKADLSFHPAEPKKSLCLSKTLIFEKLNGRES
jgi:hypothetical protein